MDRQWWATWLARALKFRGMRVAPRSGFRGLQRVYLPWYPNNSGAQAIVWAAHEGAARIVLLGYDCQHTGGRRHWHGDHPANCAGNAGSVEKWPDSFAEIARKLPEVEIINCSRETALMCFPRMDLEAALR